MSLTRCLSFTINKNATGCSIHFIRNHSTRAETKTKNKKFPKIDDHTLRMRNALLDIAVDRKKTLNKAKQAVKYDNRTLNTTPKQNDHTIQISLTQAKSSDEIFSIIQTHWNIIKYPSVYSIAIKQCIEFRDWIIIRRLMDLLIYSAVEPTIFEFTQFFNAMALSHYPWQISDEYFKRMCNEYKIIPDKFIFSILIKGCRKECMYELAEDYWVTMIVKYNITPTSYLYTEMISVYAKSNQKRKAIKLFEQFSEKLKNKQIKFDVTTFHAYLTIFTQNGDINGMEQALILMKSFNISLNKLFVTEIMNGYIRGRKPKRAIDIFNAVVGRYISINDMDIKGKEPMLELKCIALCYIMKDDQNIWNNLEKKKSLYDEILMTMDRLMQYGHKANFSFYHAKTLLFAAIVMYSDNNPMEIVTMFEDLVNGGYIMYEQSENEIDLYRFELIQVQFILRYVIGNIKDNNKDLLFNVGMSKHNFSDTNNMLKLKQFVIKELLTYEPPIRCKKEKNNEGRLCVNKEELASYVNDENNYAMRKLINPSNDWYWDDPTQINSSV
eukprot:348563_1